MSIRDPLMSRCWSMAMNPHQYEEKKMWSNFGKSSALTSKTHLRLCKRNRARRLLVSSTCRKKLIPKNIRGKNAFKTNAKMYIFSCPIKITERKSKESRKQRPKTFIRNESNHKIACQLNSINISVVSHLFSLSFDWLLCKCVAN